MSAQEVRVTTGQAWFGHELLGSPIGIGAEIGVPILPRSELIVGYDSYRDAFQSFGSTCIGLVLPGDSCSDEMRDESSRVRTQRIGMAFMIADPGQFQVEVLPSIKKSQVESEQVGRESGRRRAAQKTLYGLEAGLRVSYEPTLPVPLRLGVSIQTGFLESRKREYLADGYSPFEDGTFMGQLSALVSVGL